MNLKKLDIMQIGMGVITEKLCDGLTEVLQNIFDPNTKPTVPRKVVLDIIIKPAPDRTHADYSINMRTKLADCKSFDGMMFIGRRGDQYEIFEQDPDQLGIFTTKQVLEEKPNDD